MGSDARFLLAAALLHAAGLVAAWRTSASRERAERPPEQVQTVEVEWAPLAPETAPEPPARASAPASLAVPHADPRGAPSPSVPAEPTPAPTSTPTTERNRFDPLPGDQGPILGLPGGPALWGAPGVLPLGAGPVSAPAPTSAPAPRAPDRDVAGRVLREELHRRDKEIGIDLPAAGTVASAVAGAVYASTAPLDARATFAVRLDGAGKVLDVRVLGMTDGSAAVWERVAKAAAAQLAGRRLAMPEAYAGGAIVTVTMTSVVQLPSGKKSGRAKKLLHEKDAPITVDEGKAEVTLGDLSDIGAHPRRVVSTSFSVQPAR